MALAPSCSRSDNPGQNTGAKKVIVLGIDGMDPQILQGLMKARKLPHFTALAKQGDFRLLTTTIPPQSPVAWSSFITGMNPGGHAIFDFIHRDPQTLLPDFSISRVEPPKRTLRLGSWILPLSRGKATLLRRGKAFWEILAEHGIPTTIFRVPVNFPPVESTAR
ncbi:MAG: alkaline phosphatase family protein, partial [Chloroflexota bacterium]